MGIAKALSIAGIGLAAACGSVDHHNPINAGQVQVVCTYHDSGPRRLYCNVCTNLGTEQEQCSVVGPDSELRPLVQGFEADSLTVSVWEVER